MPDAHLQVFRGEPDEPTARFDEFDVPVEEGMVVLDALHWIQGHEAPDLAVRWNCKAAKCGSCSAEVNGRPRLMCKTRLSDFELDEPITVEPMRTFPLIRDLVTDVSWNYEVNKHDPAVHAAGGRARRRTGAGSSRTSSGSRSSASASSASCARTSATCCATTRPRSRSWARASSCAWPASRCTRSTRRDRRDVPQGRAAASGYCNITKCCTEVCPEHIKITDNAIIPLKERVADAYYDPLAVGLAEAPRERRRAAEGRAAGAPSGSPRRPRRAPAEPADGQPPRSPRASIDRPGERAVAAATRASSSAPTARRAATRGRRRLGAVAHRRATAPTPGDPRAPPDASISRGRSGVQTNNVAEYTARRARARAGAAPRGAARSTCASTRS